MQRGEDNMSDLRNPTLTVFRCGSIERSEHKWYVKSSLKFFDSVAPLGRVLRSEAIFASPERTALSAWITMKENRKKQRENHSGSPYGRHDQDALIRHLKLYVDDSLFVYDASIYEEILRQANCSGYDNERVDASPYWESGIPLTQWNLSGMSGTKEADNWEVLVAPRHIQRVDLET